MPFYREMLRKLVRRHFCVYVIKPPHKRKRQVSDSEESDSADDDQSDDDQSNIDAIENGQSTVGITEGQQNNVELIEGDENDVDQYYDYQNHDYNLPERLQPSVDGLIDENESGNDESDDELGSNMVSGEMRTTRYNGLEINFLNFAICFAIKQIKDRI